MLLLSVENGCSGWRTLLRNKWGTLSRNTGVLSSEYLDNKLFNRSVSTDVISRLKAVAPSLLFDERSGQTRLSIRGRSTIFANDQPLIVVDNFPYEGDIQNINPNDIESVTLLKDAAAFYLGRTGRKRRDRDHHQKRKAEPALAGIAEYQRDGRG